MKRIFTYFKIFIYLNIFIVIFSGCNMDMTRIAYNKTKPMPFYYTNEVAKHISQEGSYKAVIFETNLFKEKEIPAKDNATVQSFLKNLKKESFVSKPKDLPEKPAYKIYLDFSKDKYVINVYNDKYVSVYPWDGDFEMDYIDMTNTHVADNLFYLCSYVVPRHN